MIARNKSEVTQFFFKVYIENEFHTFFSKKILLNRNGIERKKNIFQNNIP